MPAKRARYFLLSLLVIVVLGVASPGGPSSSYAQNNRITIGTLDLPVFLDPALANDFASWEILGQLYTGLTRQIPTGAAPAYELAAATEHQVSEDGLTHHFTLREDLVFTDGTAIDAETFANSINRVLELDRAGASIVNTVVETVSASSQYEVQFTLYRPTPYLEALVALPPFYAVHPDDYPANDIKRDETPVVGNGYYTMESYIPGEVLTLEANSNYQFGDPAKTETIVVQGFAATEELRLALVNGEVDVAWRDVLLTDAISTSENDADITLHHIPSTRMWYLYITNDGVRYDNITEMPVRQSIMMAVDRERIITNYFDGYLQPAYSLVPAMTGDAYSPLWETLGDTDAAVQILEDNGYRRRQTNINIGMVTSLTGYGDFYAGAIRSTQSDFTPIAPYMTLRWNVAPDGPIFIDALQRGDYAIAGFAWTPVVAHPDAYLRPLLHSDGVLAVNGNFDSAEIDNLLDEALATDDAALYRQAQDAIFAMHSLAPLWQDITTILYRSDIDGVNIEANYLLHYHLLERQ